jgi:membrane-associated phospholipid phosphatase
VIRGGGNGAGRAAGAAGAAGQRAPGTAAGYAGCVTGRMAAARKVSRLLEPENVIVVTLAAVGWHADGAAGLGWGLLAAVFAAVIPAAFIARGVREGRWADRDVGERRPRLVVLAFIAASVTAGLAVLAAGGAPRELTGYFGCMLASVAALAAVTAAWKISIHCAVASGSVTMLALLSGPWLIPGYALVALIAWSRVTLGEHTAAQAAAGAAAGAAAAAVSYAVIR